MEKDNPIEAQSPIDYAVQMRETLNQLLGALLSEQTRNEYLINLTNTAIDYLFYLEDNRRVIL
jgi:hypothetical protein